MYLISKCPITNVFGVSEIYGLFSGGGHIRFMQMRVNKANLRDLIAATGLVILLKLDSNRRFLALVILKFDG